MVRETHLALLLCETSFYYFNDKKCVTRMKIGRMLCAPSSFAVRGIQYSN